MFYVVKKGRVPGIYENKDEALKQINGFPFHKMKTFKEKIDAEKYFAYIPNLFYVVKVGRVPGIYTSREELSAQVKDYPNAIVKTFKNEKEAKEYFAKDTLEVIKEKEQKELEKKIKIQKNKENYQEKIDKYLKDGISIKGKNICFIDIEANKGFAISLGAVIYDTDSHKILDVFSKFMRYDSFDNMDSYCSSIHHIKEEDILSAKKSDEVMNDFALFISKYEVLDIFAWGGCDKVFLRKSLTDKTLMDKIPNITNIQTCISCITQDIKFNKAWSLQNMKKFYGIEGEVMHDALSDAKDLAKVFQCFQDKKQIDKNIILDI